MKKVSSPQYPIVEEDKYFQSFYFLYTMRNNHVVIMAGGIGSRFWPLSTPEFPKQFIDILGVGRSLLQLTFDRFLNICDPQNVWVVTNKIYAETVAETAAEFDQLYAVNFNCPGQTVIAGPGHAGVLRRKILLPMWWLRRLML